MSDAPRNNSDLRIGSISAHELYTLETLELRLGLGAWALRQARRRGLRVLRCGARGYVLGSDVIAYLTGETGCRHPSKSSHEENS
jgi:hypothetical protein